MIIDGVEPVKRHNTLAEDTYYKLRLAIMAGAVKPGEKISTRSVADSAQVSFTPAREAVTRLIAEGALELIGPKTVVVPTLTLDDLDEITKIRKNVEGMAAEYAVTNLSKSDLCELELIQSQYEGVRKRISFQESLRINEEFHFKIYKASRLPRLIAIIENLWLQTGPSFNLLNSQWPLCDRPHECHRNAIEGLIARDGERVRRAILEDIDFGYERLRILFDD